MTWATLFFRVSAGWCIQKGWPRGYSRSWKETGDSVNPDWDPLFGQETTQATNTLVSKTVSATLSSKDFKFLMMMNRQQSLAGIILLGEDGDPLAEGNTACKDSWKGSSFLVFRKLSRKHRSFINSCKTIPSTSPVWMRKKGVLSSERE